MTVGERIKELREEHGYSQVDVAAGTGSTAIVISNIDLINASLDKITNGDLDEVVRVRNSSEFASLSDDINETVDVVI